MSPPPPPPSPPSSSSSNSSLDPTASPCPVALSHRYTCLCTLSTWGAARQPVTMARLSKPDDEPDYVNLPKGRVQSSSGSSLSSPRLAVREEDHDYVNITKDHQGAGRAAPRPPVAAPAAPAVPAKTFRWAARSCAREGGGGCGFANHWLTACHAG